MAMEHYITRKRNLVQGTIVYCFIFNRQTVLNLIESQMAMGQNSAVLGE